MTDIPNLQSWIFGVGGLIGTIATAIATIFLWRVTSTLAVETKRMAEAAAQPHIVITLSPNRWSMRHFDISIENTGNAVAYDIRAAIDPPIANGEARKDRPIPFSYVSVLKPGQCLTSYVSEHGLLEGENYLIEISWLADTSKTERQKNKYTLSMADHAGVSRLGNDPMVDIARHLKGLDENIKSVFKNHKSINVDVHTAKERRAEHEEMLASFDAFEARQKADAADQNDSPLTTPDDQE